MIENHLSQKASDDADSALPRLPDELQYIVIEGVIGAGKSSLAKLLAQRHGSQLVLEEFDANPFLSRFYEDRPRWAFQTQLSFLASRFRQQQSLHTRDLFHQSTISDYAFDKDRIFARLNLDGDELQLYESLYTMMQPTTPIPNMIIYLQSSTPRLMQNIRKRARSYEDNMDESYIESLNQAYNQYFFHYVQTPLLIVNATNIDFVHNVEDLDDLIRQVGALNHSGTTYYNPSPNQMPLL